MTYECVDCGLCAMDLPDGVEPEFVFVPIGDDDMRCQACEENQ